MSRKNLEFMMFASLGALAVTPAALAQADDDPVFDTVVVTAHSLLTFQSWPKNT